ncbi:MAG: hypothetical protein H0T73_08440, partial [Ardenticatenales bacterium]|nr:hypothetical protein [Ardenticatenales bacterium]
VPLWAQEWQVTQSPHFLILTDPAVAEQAALLTAEAEVSYQHVAEQLSTLSLSERYVMLVPASQERFTELTEQGHETQGVASHNTLIQNGAVETNSLRFVLNGASLEEFPFEYRQQTITHELVHLLLATSTRSYTPPWVAEGTATFFGEGIPWDTLRPWLAGRGTERTTLADVTRPEHFADWGEEQSIPIQYAYSAALVAYLVETYGAEAFLEFYQDYARTENEQAYSEALKSATPVEATDALRLSITEELLQEHFEQSLESLEPAFEGWVLRNAAEQSS